jgi:hypothetical protein
MKEVVYIMGAGVNQVVRDWDGDSPPLLNNFFNVALKKRRFNDDHYFQKIKDVYEYIEKHFKKNMTELRDFPFDLELCFTLLERQIKQAIKDGKKEELNKLVNVKFHLEAFLAEVLSDYEHFASTSYTMRNLGKVVFYEKPTIITFNYDCLMESILEMASGVNPNVPESFRDPSFFENRELPDELLVYSHCYWNRPLAYGFKFDEIQLQQAGVIKFVRGSRFYSIPQNQLYPKPLLKLHGSLNWFRYIPVRSYPTLPGEIEPELGEKELEIILKHGTWWSAMPPEHDGWFITPIIVTPVLYKDEYYDEKPFKEIWELAKGVLSKCKKLVIIGYSFSPTDFTTKHLLIESLMNNDLEELIVVNPDHNLVKVVKELCHFNGGVVWYSNLDDYLQTFSKHIKIESKPVEISEADLPEDTSPHDLHLKCKTCGIEFPAGIRIDPRSFATIALIGNMHICPNGHANSYDKPDYTLKKVEKL